MQIATRPAERAAFRTAERASLARTLGGFSPLDYDNLIQWALDKGRAYQATPASGVWYLEPLENTLGGKTAYPMRLDTSCITLNGGYGTGNAASLDGKVELTIQATFRMHATTGAHPHIVTVGDATNEVRLKIHTDGTDTIQGYIDYDGTIVNANPNNAPASVEGEGWHTAVFSVADGEQRLYLDGSLVSSASASLSGGLATSTNLFLGSYHTAGSRLRGDIADLRIYDGAKTPAEIQLSPTTDILEWYSCQDNYGATVSSTSGNHITLDPTGDDIADMRANKCPGYVKDWLVEFGGTVITNDQMIPGQIDSSGLDVNGSFVDSTGGKYHPGVSDLNRDPNSEPALAGLDGTTNTEDYREDVLGFRDRLLSALPSFS